MDEETSNAKKIAMLHQELQDEEQEWTKNGIHPIGINIVSFYLNEQFFALVDYLEKIIPEFDGVAFEVRYLERLVANLPQQRMNALNQMERQKLTAGIVGPDGLPVGR